MIILDFKTKNHEQSNLRAATITRKRNTRLSYSKVQSEKSKAFVC